MQLLLYFYQYFNSLRRRAFLNAENPIYKTPCRTKANAAAEEEKHALNSLNKTKTPDLYTTHKKTTTTTRQTQPKPNQEKLKNTQKQTPRNPRISKRGLKVLNHSDYLFSNWA
ncbi:MAG: hypothetical protein QW677_11235, partial [Pyrobaculum sp.]|uniref:hypothetical protein n=3 Tax=Pyrobaculum sp. TaxID=2004705 RepID=UPI0031668B35